MTATRTCLLALMCCSLLPSQPPKPVVSPEVHPDRTVTFRVRAPKATEVTMNMDWSGDHPALKKDSEGVWSVTLGPLEPSIYIYSFNIDGVAVPDPINPRVKLRAQTSASLLEVPSGKSEVWEPRDVPHGVVEINWQKSKVIDGETRWYWVYTPPDYDKSNKRYPVLYLLHGNNDTPAGWTMVGNANFVLDNLLAEKKMVPMIVVMPYGHAAPYGARNNSEMFEDYLLKDIIPAIEARYRVAPGRQNRALAGLSMGGGQALSIGFGHLDLFSAIGAFSAAVPRDFETQFAEVLKDPKATNDKLKLVWFACGRDDSLFGRAEQLSATLRKHGIKHTFVPTPGVHNFTVWRQYLAEMAPLLFR